MPQENHGLRRPFLLLLALFLAALQQGCSGVPRNEEQEPKRDGEIERLVIMGTNDIHGTLAAEKLKTREPEGVTPIPYEAGGVATIASYAKLFRSLYGDHFIWLDAGDEFQGSIDSNYEKGAPLVSFFNYAGLTAAAVGNHEFDFGASKDFGDPNDLTSSLKQRMTEAHYPYLAANIFDKSTGAPASFPNTFPSKIFQAGRLKVGVIGLSTLDTPTTTVPTYVAKLEFGSLKDATLAQAQALRAQGANIIVIVAHVGIHCERGQAPEGAAFRRPADPQGECGKKDEMVRLLESLPPGTVDAVVSGHSHTVVHHWVAGVPVVQGAAYSKYVNLIYLNYDWKQKKVLADRSRIEGPLPVCPKVFENQGDCNGDRPESPGAQGPNHGRGELVPLKYHGGEVDPDSGTLALLKPVFDRTAPIKAEVLAQAAAPIEHQREKESELGDLITDAIRKTAGTDFALMNSGGIRSSIEQGPLTFEEVFHALPFNNTIAKLTLSGAQLKLLLRVAESDSRGFPPVSGLKLTLIPSNDEAPWTDLNGDKKAQPWEFNRILDIRTSAGEKIQDGKTYTLATVDFLTLGGDDWEWLMKQLAPSQVVFTPLLIRDSVVSYIRELAARGPLNSPQSPILSPENRRMRFEAPPKSGKGRKRRRHAKKT